MVKRQLFDSDHEAFRSSVRGVLDRNVAPYAEKWERDGIVPREMFRLLGDQGFLGHAVPEEHGGGGATDFRFNAVLHEELAQLGCGGVALGPTLHADIVLPYFLTYASNDQARRWLPGIAAGELITAVAMTEPGVGSDLGNIATTAIWDGETYVVNGSKTFITNGINADLIVTAVKTDPSAAHHGVSLLVLERGMDGFVRGRNLDKIGQHAQDTAELFFDNVRVPPANLLGTEGAGFSQLMAMLPQERLSIGLHGVAAARAALDWTLDYTRERSAFGRPIAEFQNTKFTLAELATEIDVAQAYIDTCIRALNASELSVADGAKAKYHGTELQGRVTDACLQLHGGYGYITEYPIARAYTDARVTRIYGGTTEIMKEIISRSL